MVYMALLSYINVCGIHNAFILGLIVLLYVLQGVKTSWSDA